MERPLTHRQLQELLGAYALDAVEPDEAEAVELHLRDCPRCRAEVEDHRETAAMLAHVGAPAPAGLWDRIADQLEEEAPDFETGVGRRATVPGSPPAPAEPFAPRTAAAEAVAAPDVVSDDEPPGGVLPLSTRRGRAGRPLRAPVTPRAGSPEAPPSRPGAALPGLRRIGGGQPWAMRVASAGLAAAAVLAVVLGIQVVRLNDRLDRVNATMSRAGLDQAALAAMADPAARRVHLRSDDGSQQAEAVMLPDGQAYLVRSGLRPLPSDQTYQLWAVVGDQKISVGVLGAAPSVTAFRYSAQPSVLAITAERAGGVVASDKTPVVVGAVPPTPA